MERLDEPRATLVDQPWLRLRGAVIAERRMVAATLTDALPAIPRMAPRTPPAPPPRPQAPRTQPEAPSEPTTSDPLQELAEGRRK